MACVARFQDAPAHLRALVDADVLQAMHKEWDTEPEAM